MPHATPHRRRSIRLPDYDYTTPGAYFVTICTHERECLFGEVTDGEMVLNEYGKIVVSCLQMIPNHFEHVRLDEYVIMPNHVHVIMVFGDDEHPWGRGAACCAPTAPIRGMSHPNVTPGSLGAVVRSFKSAVTKHINTLRHTPVLPVWQRNYHEYVIRNDRGLAAIRDYIATNPSRWLLDRNHPGNMSVDR